MSPSNKTRAAFGIGAAVGSTFAYTLSYTTTAATAATIPARQQGHVELPMTVTEQAMETRVKLAESRADTLFERLSGKIDTLIEKLVALTERIGKVETGLDKLDNRIDANFKWMIGGFVFVMSGLAGGFLWLADKIAALPH